jgi:copper chaperone CopZ
MKKIIFIAVLIFSVQSLCAQFRSATLQATGLTCAMCSNAVNKALQKVSFVAAVTPDIKNSSFTIVFNEGSDINIDALKAAVEDAGFSVGSLKLNGMFNSLSIEADKHVKIGNRYFMFVGVKTQTLNGEASFKVIDKGFVPEKQTRKINTMSKMACLQTGKAGACCLKEGITEGERVYHVTI